MSFQTHPSSCRICGCTDDDCTDCITRTGQPCYWIEPDLCSACLELDQNTRFKIERARREADEVSDLISAGKRVPRSMTEDLRNRIRELIHILEHNPTFLPTRNQTPQAASEDKQ